MSGKVNASKIHGRVYGCFTKNQARARRAKIVDARQKFSLAD
jgi:hypothetical protein